MDLRKFSDEQLLESTWQLACADRRLVTALLHHLNEIAVRRLFAKASYPSLFEYCVRRLKFTEAQAQKRICTARMLSEYPEIEPKIASGALNLNSVTKAYRLFKQKDLPLEHRRKILADVECKSSREVEKIILSHSDKKICYVEKISLVSETLTEYRFAADAELSSKLDRLRDILKSNSVQSLVAKMADVALQKYDPLKKAQRNLNVAKRRAASVPGQVKLTRHIPAQVRHSVWLRDKATCTHPGCGSQYGLELDHIILFAHGGPHTVENLRLRCRAHNQLHAENELGAKKMSAHWQS
jgi:5-methylcytosine-specific restriction endonuclease McrA